MDWTPLLISLKTATVSIVITFFVGLIFAYWITRIKSSKVKMIVDGFFTLPLVLPPTVVGFFLLAIFGVNQPIGKFVLTTLGHTIVFSWWATVLAAGVVSFPLMYRSARGAMEQVDQQYVLAAKTLGMNEMTTFIKVIFPLAKPGIIAGAVLAFARGLGEFGATIMIAGNIAGKTQTLPLSVYTQVMGGNMEGAYDYVLILSVISFCAIVGINYFSLWGGRKS